MIIKFLDFNELQYENKDLKISSAIKKIEKNYKMYYSLKKLCEDLWTNLETLFIFKLNNKYCYMYHPTKSLENKIKEYKYQRFLNKKLTD